uniref:Translocase of outer mitochondrial membrane 6 n=1 Tax=Anas platyrhynchos TaxID=8839 RepID=A0A8B9TLS5_ANAPL
MLHPPPCPPARPSRAPEAPPEGGGCGGDKMAASGAVAAGGPVAPRQGLGGWLRGLLRFAADRNDFRRNLLLNLGLFAAGVWVARNLTDIDLMAPQPAA